MNAKTPEEVLHDLRLYDFPSAYRTRLVVFGANETDDAAAVAARTSAESLSTKDEVLNFLNRLWGFTAAALNHGNYSPEHEPALIQLEIELANTVMTLRGQVLNRL